MTEPQQHIFDVTEADFEETVLVASTRVPVLVDFWAPWCAPCKQLAPVLDKIVAGYRGRLLLAKVNTDEQGQLAQIFGVRSLPTVLLIKDGRPIDGFPGAQPESAIRAMLEPHIGPEPPAEPEEPEAPPRVDAAQRVTELRAAIAKDPAKDELKAELAQALAETGAVDEAQSLIDALPANHASGDPARKARAAILIGRALADAPPRDALEARVAADPADLAARRSLGARLLAAGDAAGALDEFLEIMRRDRKFDDDAGRKSLIAALELVEDPALVSATRKRMSALIF